MKIVRKNVLLFCVMCIGILGLGLLGNGYVQNRKLFAAIRHQDYEAAKQAVERGAFVNMRRHWAYLPNILQTNPTPLILACQTGDMRLIELLLDNGADINRKDNFTDDTPLLSIFRIAGEFEGNRFAYAKYLIEKGADPNMHGETNSPLKRSLMIRETDNARTVKEGYQLFVWLMENSEAAMAGSYASRLVFAASEGHTDAVRYLIQNGYHNIDEFDEKKGITALIAAVQQNNADTVRLLLKLGANVVCQSKEGKNALEYARAAGNIEIIKLLELAVVTCID